MPTPTKDAPWVRLCAFALSAAPLAALSAPLKSNCPPDTSVTLG
jgi:hypothetical protein